MILVVNAGSSSLKCKLYSTKLDTIGSVIIKNFAVDQYDCEIQIHKKVHTERITKEIFNQPFQYLIETFQKYAILKSTDDITSIVHRIVHGGENFIAPIEITDEVFNKLLEYNTFAPLHNPIALDKVLQSKKVLHAKQYAVFDTAFHATVPKENYLYGLPYGYYENLRIRRYGFHGISYQYIVNEFAKQSFRNKFPNKIIACHLGSGSSVCAILEGKSINHSFGFTPNENLIMATRSGEVDYDAVAYLRKKLGLTDSDVSTLLNSESGLLGISGYTKDMKTLLVDYANHDRAKLAVDMYVNKIVNFISQFYIELNGCDALIFTGGIGAGSDVVRQMIVNKLAILNISINQKLNHGKIDVSEILNISSADSKTQVMVVPTDEELQMAREIVQK